MFGVAIRQITRHDLGGDRAEPGDDRARFVEPTSMGIACGEKSVCDGSAEIFLHREKQGRRSFVKPTFEKMGLTDPSLRRTRAFTRAQTQRGFDMRDRKIGFTRPQPDDAAGIPTAGVAWVEREGTVDQRHWHTDILAKLRQNDRRVTENCGVTVRHPERLPGKIAGFATTCIRRFDPAVNRQYSVAYRCPGKCPPVMRSIAIACSNKLRAFEALSFDAGK